MLEPLTSFLDISSYMPHGYCYQWNPVLIGLHVASDGLIGTAYVVISLTLWQLVRRIRMPFSPMVLAFGVFIGACGLTHYMEIYTLWIPDYWLAGLVKAVTALASVATGAYLVNLRPTIVSVAAAAQVSEERRVALEVAHRELERLYARVKELDDAKTRFFANASHELRTPLALILGPLEKLLAGAPVPEARRDLEVARRNARLLLRHVNDLLDVARLEEGKLPLAARDLDLAALARDVARMFEGLARDRRVDLRVDGPEALPARADAEKLERVLANLLGNAFKFTPEGGHVHVRLASADGRLELSVDDDGPGIAPEQREAVFERFRQDPGRAGQGGAGLGLAIAREFVELHGGRVTAGESALGGARLLVELPLVPVSDPAAGATRGGAQPLEAARAVADALQPGPAAAMAPARPAAPPGAPTVLVVEDHAEARALVADALAADFQIATASDGAEGLTKAEALRPDAIVTDMMMPGTTGEELVAELRRRPALADVPALVLTARADHAVRVRLLQTGAQDYVLKPFLAEELRARVKNLVAVKRSRDTLSAELAGHRGDLEGLASELAARKRELEVALDTAQVAREQAERASAVKSTFLGMVSHELRTPITSLQLAAGILSSGRAGPLGDRQRATVERIEAASKRLLDTVESLLEYTRVESGKLVVRVEPFDLAAAAEDVVQALLPQAQRKLLTLRVERAAALAPLPSDPRLVRIVLMNLVTNAIRYTERGEIVVAAGGAGRAQWLEVRDSGVGIAREDLPRVFQPFEQLSPASGTGGVGLGLTLVQGIVSALGGEIALRSAPGEGTTFRVSLPAIPAGGTAAEGAAPSAPAP